MTTFTQGIQTGEWLLSHAHGERSREQGTVTVAGSVELPSGTVLGKIDAASATAAAVAGNTGNGAMGAITVSAGAKAGVYKLTIVEPAGNAGAFVVEDPDGVVMGNGDVAAAFSAGGLAFTLADGATDFAAGDQINITVTGSGKYVKYDPDGTDGRNRAVAVLWEACPGVNGDYKRAFFDCDCEVIGAMLNGGAGLGAAGIADLKTRGIKVR